MSTLDSILDTKSHAALAATFLTVRLSVVDLGIDKVIHTPILFLERTGIYVNDHGFHSTRVNYSYENVSIGCQKLDGLTGKVKVY